MINLNFSQKAEYKLHNDMTYEYIRMYGIACKLILTKKCGRDGVFGDYTHYEVDNAKTFQIYGLPENSEGFDVQQYMFEDYGISDYNTCNIFVSTYDFDEKHSNLKLNEIIGNFVVLPSGKVMEITSVDYMTPHVNNLFAYADRKSVYKLTLDPYEFRVQDNINHEELNMQDVNTEIRSSDEVKTDSILEDSREQYSQSIETGKIDNLLDDLKETENYNALDNYFERLVKVKEDVDNEAVELTGNNITVKTKVEKDVSVIEEEVNDHLNPQTPTYLKEKGPIQSLNNISKIKVQETVDKPIYPKRKVSKFTGF